MRQQLENMMDSYQPRISEHRQLTYFVVGDLESLSASALYSRKIGKFSGFDSMSEDSGMIKKDLDLGQYFPEAKGIFLEQRYDATHGNFHLNQDLVQENGYRFKPKQDLGPAHNIDLNIGSQS